MVLENPQLAGDYPFTFERERERDLPGSIFIEATVFGLWRFPETQKSNKTPEDRFSFLHFYVLIVSKQTSAFRD